jgi:hypothetical protein
MLTGYRKRIRMTVEQIQFIFDALKELKEDVKDLKKFKDRCQGGLWLLTVLGSIGYVALQIAGLI